MLDTARVAARLPVQNLERAPAFYSEKLGLEPREERDGGLLYPAASGEFALFESAGASPGTFTQMAPEVDDIESTVAELRARGVVVEEVDLPGLRTLNGIAEIAGLCGRCVVAVMPIGATTSRLPMSSWVDVLLTMEVQRR
jgi:catechol 2,3-dioxygenase-like lactoylglutathione lyase family enzyme